MFSAISLPFLLLIFCGAAIAIWIAGVQLSNTTDVLSTRLGLGEALGGVILLAIAANLPEIAITVSAALRHNLDLATGNILGGIAVQTVVLVLLDIFGVRGRSSLMYHAASLTLMLEGLLVIAVLTTAIMATQLPQSLILLELPLEHCSSQSYGQAGYGLWAEREKGCRGTSKAMLPNLRRTIKAPCNKPK